MVGRCDVWAGVCGCMISGSDWSVWCVICSGNWCNEGGALFLLGFFGGEDGTDEES